MYSLVVDALGCPEPSTIYRGLASVGSVQDCKSIHGKKRTAKAVLFFCLPRKLEFTISGFTYIPREVAGRYRPSFQRKLGSRLFLDGEKQSHDHGTQNGSAGDRLLISVKEGRPRRGPDPYGDGCHRCSDDDQGAQIAARRIASPHHHIGTEGGIGRVDGVFANQENDQADGCTDGCSCQQSEGEGGEWSR